MKSIHLLRATAGILSLGLNLCHAETSTVTNSATEPRENCFLFSYFVGNGEDGLHLARSSDGYHWQALHGGKSLLAPRVGKSRLIRDPCLLRAPDGTFQMVWTNGWNDRTIGYASSKDLLHWSQQQAIGVMAHEPQALNCWAPEVVYDEAKQQYVIFWSTTIPGRFPQTDGTGDGKYNHRIYSTTTKDFKSFTPTRLFFDGGFNVIDATMLHAEGKYYLIVKDETLKPVKKNLRIAVGDSPEGPFGHVSAPFTPSWVEGPSAIRVGDEYVVYFDCYNIGRYGAVRSRNLKDWEDVTSRVSFPQGTRHGTVLRVPRSVVDNLDKAWSTAEATDQELLAGADARIEQCRKADATVVVVDAAGKPIAGAKIDVEQTRHAFLFGCNIYLWGSLPDKDREQAYRQRFAELLNYATLPFYWGRYEPQRGKPTHAHAEEVARWCRAHGVLTKGHPLAWNNADPPWLPGDADEIHRLQMARIDDCVKRFAGLIDRWDVVNEVTHYDREEFVKKLGPRYTAMWKKYGQIALTRECFLHARQANPQAVLLINDYRTDPAYERVIEQLVDEKGRRLCDVIGIQSHMHGGVWSNGQIWKTCERFARFGVPLHFTETTILSGERVWDRKPGQPWPSTQEGEAYQAEEAERFYTMLFSHPAVAGITWWDFSDFHSWKGAPAGLVRKDMTPKPAYRALDLLIKGKWWTRTKIQTGGDGTARFRGFLGDYQLTVSVGNQVAVVKAVALEKGKANRWMVKAAR